MFNYLASFANLPTAIRITGVGMLGIFGVTTVIILCVYLLNRIMSGNKKDK